MNFLAALDTNVILAVLAYTILIIRWGNKISSDTESLSNKVTEGFDNLRALVKKIEDTMENKGYALCQMHDLRIQGTEARIKRMEQITNGHHKGEHNEN